MPNPLERNGVAVYLLMHTMRPVWRCESWNARAFDTDRANMLKFQVQVSIEIPFVNVAWSLHFKMRYWINAVYENNSQLAYCLIKLLFLYSNYLQKMKSISADLNKRKYAGNHNFVFRLLMTSCDLPDGTICQNNSYYRKDLNETWSYAVQNILKKSQQNKKHIIQKRDTCACMI